MSIFNEILEGRFNRALQKLTSIKGSPPVRQLGSEIMPGWSLPLGAEFRYLEGWNRFSQAMSPGAAVGFNSVFRMINPVNSAVITVIERLHLFNSNAATMDVRVEGWTKAVGTALATNLNGTEVALDNRTISGSAMNLSQQNTAVVPSLGRTVFFFTTLPQNASVEVIPDIGDELTLLPGDTCQVRAATVNQSLGGNIWWRERSLSDSEFK